MRKHGEKWIIDVEGVQHLVMAVKGRGKRGESPCHGCSYVDKWDDDCTLKKVPCDMGCKIKDLGPVDDNGLLSCPFCGSTLAVIEDDGFYAECPNSGCALCKTESFIEKQYLVEACNQREAL